MHFYGIDVHSDSMTAAVKEHTGGPSEPRVFSCSLSGPRFEEFLDRLENDDHILIEATTLSFWFVEQVANRVAACHVLNTHKLAKQGNNTDKIDAPGEHPGLQRNGCRRSIALALHRRTAERGTGTQSVVQHPDHEPRALPLQTERDPSGSEEALRRALPSAVARCIPPADDVDGAGVVHVEYPRGPGGGEEAAA